jgi:hypothetical protein
VPGIVHKDMVWSSRLAGECKTQVLAYTSGGDGLVSPAGHLVELSGSRVHADCQQIVCTLLQPAYYFL